MWVPPCDESKLGNLKNQIVDPSLQSSSTFNESDPMEETLEWFMKPKVMLNSSTFQVENTTHKFNPESNLNTCHPLSYFSNDILLLYLLDWSFLNPSSD